MTSLSEFAKTTTRHCEVCALPEPLQKEILEGWASGIRAAAIVLWLEQEKKVKDVTPHRIRNHIEHTERRNGKGK